MSLFGGPDANEIISTIGAEAPERATAPAETRAPVGHGGPARPHESMRIWASSVAITTPVGIHATDFRGRSGATTVACDWKSYDLGGSYVVARAHPRTKIAAHVALGTGVVLLIAGAIGITMAMRRRAGNEPSAGTSTGSATDPL